MEASRSIPPLLVGDGTLIHPRDMLRALETVEGFSYRYVADGETISEGRATLVRLMIDDESASVLVNGCLFLNVNSLQYLSFYTDTEGQARFICYLPGATLEMTPIDEPDARPGRRQIIRIMDESVFDADSFVSLDDDDDE